MTELEYANYWRMSFVRNNELSIRLMGNSPKLNQRKINELSEENERLIRMEDQDYFDEYCALRYFNMKSLVSRGLAEWPV